MTRFLFALVMLSQLSAHGIVFASEGTVVNETTVDLVSPNLFASDVLGEENGAAFGSPCEDAGYVCRPPHHGEACRDVGGILMHLSCGHPGTGYHCCDR